MNDLSQKISQFDALFIIHPDCGDPINSNYRENLRKYITAFQENGKKIYVDDVLKIKDSQMKELFKAIARLYYDNDHPQLSVDFIAKDLRKSPSDLRIAFGGTHANLCVYSMATEMCKVLETNHEGTYKEKPVMNPIGFGKVLDDIV